MNTMLAAFLGGWEVVAILAAILILFGAKKVPELMRGMGQGIKEFKKATRDVSDELNSTMDDSPSSTPQKKIPAATVPNEPSQPSQTPPAHKT